MIVWFSGVSGAGKSTIGRFFFKKFKKKFSNSIYIDGDEFRELMNNDLGHDIKSRNLNALRLTRFVKFISNQKINIIVAANLTSPKYRKWCKINLKNYYDIFIEAKLENLIKRDYKNLYKLALSKKIKNVVGVDIPFNRPNGCYMYVSNVKTKNEFLKKTDLILKKLKL